MLRSYRGRAPRPNQSTVVPIQTMIADNLPPWFFHPGRHATGIPADHATDPVEAFRKRLQAISPDLEIAWHPISHRWQIWTRDPGIRTEWCQGWRRLFFVQNLDTTYAPLDMRVLAELFFRDANQYSGAMDYFRRHKRERAREKASRRAARDQEIVDMARDQWNYSLIKVSMRGHSSGSKFADHHAGE